MTSPGPGVAPTMQNHTDARLADGDHVVHFYAADADLVGAVVAYLRAALTDGDIVLMIATPEHRQVFEAALTASSVDVAAARLEDRLVVLDAAETLSTFMLHGVPDPVLFDSTVGALVRAAGASGRGVRAYGEMVALLWDEGLPSAAVELEELWNGLGDRSPFALFCGYPAGLMSSPEVDREFSAVCHLHTNVIAGAPTPAGAEVARRFPRSAESSARARRFVDDTLRGWGLDGQVEEAALLVTELATNAVRHAQSDFTIGLSRTGGGVRIEVGDASSASPHRRRSGLTDTGGRGLLIVNGIARRWGHRQEPGGKVVWAELVPDRRTANV